MGTAAGSQSCYSDSDSDSLAAFLAWAHMVEAIPTEALLQTTLQPCSRCERAEAQVPSGRIVMSEQSRITWVIQNPSGSRVGAICSENEPRAIGNSPLGFR